MGATTGKPLTEMPMAKRKKTPKELLNIVQKRFWTRNLAYLLSKIQRSSQAAGKLLNCNIEYHKYMLNLEADYKIVEYGSYDYNEMLLSEVDNITRYIEKTVPGTYITHVYLSRALPGYSQTIRVDLIMEDPKFNNYGN